MNVEFYSGIADELASQGFVVVGINHPYDVAATTLFDGPPLLPSLLPVPNHADHILALTRTYTLAFFDQTLRANPDTLLSTPFGSPDVRLEVYPPL